MRMLDTGRKTHIGKGTFSNPAGARDAYGRRSRAVEDDPIRTAGGISTNRRWGAGKRVSPEASDHFS